MIAYDYYIFILLLCCNFLYFVYGKNNQTKKKKETNTYIMKNNVLKIFKFFKILDHTIYK